MKKLLSFRAYAKHRGVSHESVNQAVKAGRISTVGTGSKRKIDPSVADAQWDENTKVNYRTTDATKEKPGDKKENEKPVDKSYQLYNKSRAINEAYRAKLSVVLYKEKMGELVSAEKVKNSAFKMARILRDNLLNIPDRIAHELASEKDPHKISIILSRALNEALEELSNGNREEKR